MVIAIHELFLKFSRNHASFSFTILTYVPVGGRTTTSDSVEEAKRSLYSRYFFNFFSAETKVSA